MTPYHRLAYRKKATGRNPSGSGPSLLLPTSGLRVYEHALCPVYVRLPLGARLALLKFGVLRGLYGPVDLAVPTALLFFCLVETARLYARKSQSSISKLWTKPWVSERGLDPRNALERPYKFEPKIFITSRIEPPLGYP